ncbi:hypothetical protein COU49_01435 [Candidatus Nomurabacteria bacterium CG10_big_fil_rev_8_21_14_0_10_35_16]|uniref:Membrane insertase YidC/Oxa/ALB C-terminal domain-containing protein n=1 Tax=Candidatus Nomurabacteria bacterium CG10_big_fil_rev_8_21_14_0_10_35_16 TaxID=1974731 RepID=A0A2H0TBJ1_9BACT|nr:MAG: hypothetical protein COU49_01435 [Candidatus Nomurabacteria bacterium CG10_big_fil_rev_8_21_14_0_10_35_16]
MLSDIWNIVLYKPFVNALAFLVSVIPGGNVGIAIVILTILVKLILFPFSKKSLESQAKMSIITPELNQIKKSGASKEEQARQTFELYKKHQTNPFSGCLLALIQIPIILALYYVFIKGLNFENDVLYSFVHIPQQVSTFFFGIDISQKSFILALLAGVSQYFQVHFMPKPNLSPSDDSFQGSFAKSMNMQMKYIFPVFIFFILYTDFIGVSLSGAVALYWITSNLFAVGQQIYINKTKENLVIKSEIVG